MRLRDSPGFGLTGVSPGSPPGAEDLIHLGTQTVTEGTDAIVTMATIGADGPTGTFTDRYGTVAW
jgi:hypothetical protein